VRRGREPGYVGPDLGQDQLRGGGPDAGDLIEPGHRLGERGDLGIDPILQNGDVGGDAVDPLEHPVQQERVVLGEPAGQRLAEPCGLGPQGAAGQVGQHARVAFPAIRAAIMARPETPNRSLTTTESLMRASSSSFSTRCFSAVRSASRSTR
jgi:hypothetical protein